MSFPVTRLRRLRKTSQLRDIVRETSLDARNFIMPYFVKHGINEKIPVKSMPGVFQLSIDNLVEECSGAYSDGLRSVILFGIPEKKDSKGSEALSDNGIVPKAVRKLKENIPGLIVITDVCMCEYTDHGHCGLISGDGVDNDSTIELLAKQSIVHVKAGADIIAPSDMMDGRVGHIRKALDSNGFSDIPIMAYSSKFASGFYGPFRDAAESAPKFGDRKAYQMDPSNFREAIREIEQDIEEGADIIMVKPAMPCLDIIHEAKQRFNLPLAAYQVSGEYSMIHAAALNGWIDLKTVMIESLISIKRAGADLIITYFARDIIREIS